MDIEFKFNAVKQRKCSKNTTRISDPVEIMKDRIERLQDEYIDEYTCMQCKKKVDYELVVVGPMGMGPALCEECMKKYYKID